MASFKNGEKCLTPKVSASYALILRPARQKQVDFRIDGYMEKVEKVKIERLEINANFVQLILLT